MDCSKLHWCAIYWLIGIGIFQYLLFLGLVGYLIRGNEMPEIVAIDSIEEMYCKENEINLAKGKYGKCEKDKTNSHFIKSEIDRNNVNDKKSEKFKEDKERMRINISQGELDGIKASTAKGISYWSFRGIPYAKPPIGKLRFKAPHFPEKFKGVFDATAYRPACPHISPDKSTFEGDEDCLHMYINVRYINETSLAPVIVYFNGGMFRDIRPYSELETDDLMENDIFVHVNFYYRLNILGLLSLETKEVPGNTLFKDQVMALRWIKKNIKYFGGDPNNVMIWGHSSGATSAYLHLTSPMSKNLFHKAVIHSGLLTCQWRWDQDNFGTVVAIARKLRFNESIDPEEIMIYFQSLSAEELVRTVFEMEGKDNFQNMKLSPVIEKTFTETEQFMPKSPTSAYKNKQFNDVPVMLTYTSKEIRYGDKAGTFLMNPTNFIRPFSWNLGTLGDKAFEIYLDEVMHFYFGKYFDQVNWHDIENLETGLNIAGDINYVIPTIETAKTITKHSTKPVYLLRFAHRDSLNLPYVDIYGLQGASHVDDIRYVFVNGIDIKEKSSTDYIHKRLVNFIINFARYSDPNPVDFDNILPVKWLPMTNDTSHYMAFSGELALGSTTPEQNRFEFWQKLEQKLISEAGCNDNWRDICSMQCV